MHVQCVDREVVSRELERLEDLRQCQFLTVAMNDNILNRPLRVLGDTPSVSQATHIRTVLHFVLDKSEKVLLIHAARVVDVCIDFTNVVKISAMLGKGRKQV